MKYYTKCEACESFDKCRSFDYLKLVKAEGYIGEHYVQKPSVVCGKQFTCNDCKYLDCDYRSREIGRLNACRKGHIPFVRCEDFVDENEQICEICKNIRCISPKDYEYNGKETYVIRYVGIGRGHYEYRLIRLPSEKELEKDGLTINFCPICGRKLEE